MERLLSGAVPRSWQRRWLLAAAAMATITAVTTAWWSQRRLSVAPLTDHDIVVLADFENSTGDPVFNRTLRRGLAIALEQSAFLKTLDDEVVHADLRLMQRPSGQPVTTEIAHDICVREAAAATISGAISRLGNMYVVTPGGGLPERTDAGARAGTRARHGPCPAGAERRRLLDASELGESLASVVRTNASARPVHHVSLARRAADLCDGLLAAKPGTNFSRHPVSSGHGTRSEFAMAQFCWRPPTATPETCSVEGHQTSAFRLADRVSEFERLIISARYCTGSSGELLKAIDTFRLLIAKYPRYWGRTAKLSYLYAPSVIMEAEEGRGGSFGTTP